MSRRLGIPLSLAALSFAGCGQPGGGADVVDAYGFLPVTAGRPAVAYFVVRNDGDEALELVSFATPLFERAELHETTLDDGIARMRRLDSLGVPPRGETRLEPGGRHLMLLGPRTELRDGIVCPVTATAADGSTLRFELVLGARVAPSTPEAA